MHWRLVFSACLHSNLRVSHRCATVARKAHCETCCESAVTHRSPTHSSVARAAQAKPHYETVRRNVYVSRPRPKRLPKDDIPVCSCCALAPVPRGPPPPPRPASAAPLSPTNAVGSLGPPPPARPFSAGAAPSAARASPVATLTLGGALEALAGLPGVGSATGAGGAAAARSAAAAPAAQPSAEQGTGVESRAAAPEAAAGVGPERVPGALPAPTPQAPAAAAPGSAAGSLVDVTPGLALADPAEVAQALVADMVVAVAAGTPYVAAAGPEDAAVAQADGALAAQAEPGRCSDAGVLPTADAVHAGLELHSAPAACVPGGEGGEPVQAAEGVASGSSEQGLAEAAGVEAGSEGKDAVILAPGAAGLSSEPGGVAAVAPVAAAAPPPPPPPPRDRCGENCLNRLSFITCDPRLCPAGERCSNRCPPTA